MERFRTSLPPRFWAKIARDEDGCWVWQAATRKAGNGNQRYPVFLSDGRMRRAHRLAYEDRHGPTDEQLRRECGNDLCVNPDHIKPSSYREIMQSGSSPAARNARRTHCVNGHPLTDDNVYVRPDGHGRQCRACNRAGARRHAEKKRSGRTLSPIVEHSSGIEGR